MARKTILFYNISKGLLPKIHCNYRLTGAICKSSIWKCTPLGVKTTTGYIITGFSYVAVMMLT